MGDVAGSIEVGKNGDLLVVDSDDYRQVITWCYQDGRSFEEVAALMERTENAVRKLWFRAIEQLERELGNA